MQTPFDQKSAIEGQTSEWAARSDTPKRSVFGNYRADGARVSDPARPNDNLQRAGSETGAPLQSAIDLAIARSFIHRILAKTYEDPTPGSWTWLCSSETQTAFSLAWAVAVEYQKPVAPFSSDDFESFHSAYLAAFGHAARGSCPLNEIEYGELKADPLFQPHRLADLAAFYRAFGLEVAQDADERHDHICLELEFMCVLAAKDAYALENQLDAEELALCRQAQKNFLREHLGRWSPAFARRLAAATSDPTLRAVAEFTRIFIESECVRFHVRPGSDDLQLRPVDEAAESMCASCGISNLPPGATAAT